MSESRLELSLELRLRPMSGQEKECAAPVPLKSRVVQALLGPLTKYPLLFLIVGIPLVLTIVYEVFIASPIYVSEAHFMVRSKSMPSSLNGVSDMSTLNPLTSMSQSSDYTQAVNDYLSSRDLIEVLIKKDRLMEVLSRPEADFVARFPPFWSSGTIEALWWWWGNYIYPYFDTTTGISDLYVYAFRPEDAQRIAVAALEHAEALINRLNERQQKDSIAFAQGILENARIKVRAAEQDIVDWRNREAHFDPTREGAAVITLISQLNSWASQLKAELNEVNLGSPGSPKLAGIKARIASFEQQVNEQRVLLAGGDKSLAPTLAAYEKLILERDMAVKTFYSTLLLLESAVKDMDMKRLYLDRVVEPNLPDYALYPRHYVVFPLVLGFSLCIYWVIRVLGEAIIKHEP